jgi:hypothetical protein
VRAHQDLQLHTVLWIVEVDVRMHPTWGSRGSDVGSAQRRAAARAVACRRTAVTAGTY